MSPFELYLPSSMFCTNCFHHPCDVPRSVSFIMTSAAGLRCQPKSSFRSHHLQQFQTHTRASWGHSPSFSQGQSRLDSGQRAVGQMEIPVREIATTVSGPLLLQTVTQDFLFFSVLWLSIIDLYIQCVLFNQFQSFFLMLKVSQI